MKSILSFILISFSLVSFSKEATNYSEQLIEKVNNGAKSNNLPLMQEYIRLGGDLNVQDHKGYTPLIFAAYYGHTEMVNLLLENKANPCIKDARGNTALMGAIFKGNISVAYKLMNSDCVVNQKNNANQTALMYAALFDRQEIAKKLIEKGEAVSDTDINGNSAIEVAQKQFNDKMVEVLKSGQNN